MPPHYAMNGAITSMRTKDLRLWPVYVSPQHAWLVFIDQVLAVLPSVLVVCGIIEARSNVVALLPRSLGGPIMPVYSTRMISLTKRSTCAATALTELTLSNTPQI
jgi:hypothetical protein